MDFQNQEQDPKPSYDLSIMHGVAMAITACCVGFVFARQFGFPAGILAVVFVVSVQRMIRKYR